jgi:threonine/homoserine/homoserine lactone efflux protein
MSYEVLVLYSAVAFFYIISPGPAVFLALTNGMVYNMKVVSISSFGNIIGLFLLSTVSISGLGAILTTSATLFMIVKIIGACYLVYLGIKQFRSANSLKLEDLGDAKEHKKASTHFYESFFLASTNPKPIIFFIALFPQFLNLQSAILPQFFVMTGIFMFFSFCSLCVYGYLAKSAKVWFQNKNTMILFHRVTGGMFIGLGLALTQLKNTSN